MRKLTVVKSHQQRLILYENDDCIITNNTRCDLSLRPTAKLGVHEEPLVQRGVITIRSPPNVSARRVRR